MQIEKINEGNKLTMKISGRLDTMTAPKLESEVKESLEGIHELVMDFTNLEYISSAGLRVLLLTTKLMKGKGNFVIKHINEIVNEVFEVTGFMDILNVE